MLRYVRKINGPLTVPLAPSKTCDCPCVSIIKIQRKMKKNPILCYFFFQLFFLKKATG